MIAKVLILLLMVNLVYHSVAKASSESEIQPFVCESPGYFENPSDVSCRTFYQCITFLGGLLPVSFTCPVFTNFDPELQICSLSYACPSDKSSRAAQRASNATPEMSLDNNFLIDPDMEVIRSCTPFKCTSEGIFEDPDNCGKYFVCSKFFESYVATHSPCPLFAGFDPVYRMCSFAKTCLPSIKGCIQQDQHYKEEPCIHIDYYDYFQCSRLGYFRNLNDLTCETYHSCKSTEVGMLSKETYRCPKGSNFNPHVKKCDTNYVCPCNDTNNETAATNLSEIDSNTTNIEWNSREVIEKQESSLEASEVESQQNESEYMSFIMHNESHIFENDAERKISVNLSETVYKEFSFESLHIDSDLTNLTKCSPTTAESFQCRDKGRFRDSGDNSCQSYFLCNLLRNGSFVKTKYVCPKSSSFNPNLGACDVHYKCPCEDNDQSVTTSKEDLCLYEKDPDYFTCSEKGRFENLNDLTCQSYFLCNLLKNSSFVKTNYLCPKGSYFHRNLGICSTEYICPCSSLSTTTFSSPTTDETPEITSQIPVTTEKGCKYEESSEYFSCPGKGRFENLNDLTCKSYYLCNQLKNGSFLKTKYSCPKGSLFNPSSSVCDIQYICPCDVHTTTLPPSTTDASTLSTTTQDKTTTSDDSLSTKTNDCNYEKDPDYFSCSNKGRFENLNDLDCESYFLCNLLRNGSFLKTKYMCPKGSYFHPSLSICSKTYICPCNRDTTTPSATTRAEETTEKSSVTATTTESQCRYENNPEYFSCLGKGRFEDLNDLTCQNYFLCNLLNNGSFIRTSYSCPKGSRFNPSLGVCDTKYLCPCEANPTTVSSGTTDLPTTSTTEKRTTEPDDSMSTESSVCDYQQDPEYFKCTEKGRFENLNDLDCESYFLCNLLRNGSFLRTKYLCPKGSYFNPNLHICSKSYTCPCTTSSSTTVLSTTTESTSEITSVTTTTIENQCRYEDNPEYFTCFVKGRFEDLNDRTCQSYYLCNLLQNGSYVRTKYLCPNGSRFNPSLSVCDIKYLCPCEADGSTISSSTTDLPTSPTTEKSMTEPDEQMTTEPFVCDYQQDPDYFNCTSKGRFENLNDLDCESYFLCNLLRNGSFLKTKYACPNGSYFNPTMNICSKSYICPCSSRTTTPSTTTPEAMTEASSATTTSAKRFCRYEADSEYFTCLEKGRFEDLNDLTCQSYYLCNLLNNGSLIRTRYSCPEDSRFNPSLGVCDTKYICPCEADITTMSSSTTNSPTASTTTKTTKNSVTDDLMTTESSLCDYQQDPEYYNCTSKGRFENLNDLDCESYFLCNLLRNGSFLKTKYPCPKGSYFNPSLSICSKSYICPCSSLTTTLSTTVSSKTTEETTEISSVATTTIQKRCRYEDNPEYFSCFEKGRFEDLNDLTCQSYYLCNLLKNGSFVRTRYSCPQGSRFNPSLGVCDTIYLCPCEANSSTIASSTTDLSTPSTATESDEPTTTEEYECDYQQDPEYFSCTEKGRFKNLNDLDCESYFLCNVLRNGSFLKTKYSCPRSSYFNPTLGICSKSYNCPCNSRVTTQSTIIVTTISENANETTTTHSSSTTAVSTTSSRITESGDSLTTEGAVCDYQSDSEYFTCTKKGRYVNLNDPACESYFLCNLLRNGSFLRTKYACPQGSYFNPDLSICSTKYICPCTGSITTESSSAYNVSTEDNTTACSTTASTGRVCVYENDPDYFSCTTNGSFVNHNDPTCKSFFLCNLLGNGTFSKTKYFCPKGLFNPDLSLCDSNFSCPCLSLSSSSASDIISANPE